MSGPEFQKTEAAALFDGAAYAEMVQMLERAQKTIRVTFYLFGGPDAERMCAVLTAKQAAGVDVKVLLDRALGLGPTLPGVLWECQRMYQHLRRLGIDVRRTDSRSWPESPEKAPLSHHNYIVVDDQEALVGGMNVGTLFRHYHDLMMRIAGPVAAELSRQFDLEWDLACGGALPKAEKEFEKIAPFSGVALTAAGPTLARIVGTGRGCRTTQTALEQNLWRAEKSVCVALCEIGRTPLIEALIACHCRGVRVRVLLDPQVMGPIGPAGILNAGAVERLLDAGIAVHLYQLGRDFVRLHLKMAVFDGLSAVAGSTNWTRGGFEWVGETDVEMHGGSVVAELSAQFERDWARSAPALPPTFSARFLHGLYERWAQ
ncbi:MAG: phospholipase D-like domain-containing protein [Janthinobacterium lividum]